MQYDTRKDAMYCNLQCRVAIWQELFVVPMSRIRLPCSRILSEFDSSFRQRCVDIELTVFTGQPICSNKQQWFASVVLHVIMIKSTIAFPNSHAVINYDGKYKTYYFSKYSQVQQIPSSPSITLFLGGCSYSNLSASPPMTLKVARFIAGSAVHKLIIIEEWGPL